MFLTYRYRLRDRRQTDRRALRAQAGSVNFVWNYCCEIQREAERRWRSGRRAKWPTFFDLNNLTAHCAAEIGLHSSTVTAICRAFTTARDKAKRHPGWRSGRTNLDWIPIHNAARADYVIRLADSAVTFRKHRYRLWWHRELPSDAKLKTAAFACDARGRWYFNVTFETAELCEHGGGEIGIDLGLSALATLSTGEVIPNLRHAARYAKALATAQRTRSRRRVRAIHAKITNSRRDHLHKVSTDLMRTNRRVVVGNVSASRLAKTWLAKSVSDVGWATFREMLRYKAIRHGVEYQEVNEAYTSRTCSACGSIPASSPKGLGALRVRQWVCSDCGVHLDRDQNAALNILRAGAAHRPPVVEIAAQASV